MRLTAYQIFKAAPPIQSAMQQRDLMDESPQRSAYLCLPLVAANKLGWEFLCSVGFTAVWDGALGVEGVAVKSDDPDSEKWVHSHFGSGILTLRTGDLFQTGAGHNLLVKGSPNRLKDGVAPLKAVIETDWLPNTFSMNWKFTRPNHPVMFEKGEPFCFVAPVRRQSLPSPRRSLPSIEPFLQKMASDPEISQQSVLWLMRRGCFNLQREHPDTEEARQEWLKNYLQGKNAQGDKLRAQPAILKLKEFVVVPPLSPAPAEAAAAAEKVPDANC